MPPASTASWPLQKSWRCEPSAAGPRARFELRLGEDRFRVDVADVALAVVRSDADRPDATIATDPGTLGAVLWSGRPLADAPA